MSNERIKEHIQIAYLQMLMGCGNINCLNPNCKVQSISQSKLGLLAMDYVKNSPGHNLYDSKTFIICEKIPPECLLKDLSGLSEPLILKIFKDPTLIGLNFIKNKISEDHSEIDYEFLDQFYQNTIKMVELGHLNAKWLESALESFTLTPYKKLYLPRACLVILRHPLLSEIEFAQTIVLISSQLSTAPQSYVTLSKWMDDYSKEQVHHLNWTIQQIITIEILDRFESKSLENIQNLLRLLDCLYKSNQRINRLPFTEFYNDAVNKEINLKADFKIWYRQKMLKNVVGNEINFAFAFFPWIFDSNSKSEFLNLETYESMRNEIRNAVMIDMHPDIFVRLEVSRETLIEDTLSQLLSGELNIKKPLKVHFVGEEGVDEGGVRKEFFQLIVKELFDPEFSMFNYYEAQRLFWFNPDTIESNLNFELIGMILGMAIYNSIILDVHLPMATYKKILGLPTNIEDLKDFNPELAKGLTDLLQFEGNVEETFCRSFYLETEAFGAVKKHLLKENGENIPVTNENRQEYVDLYVDWWLNKGIQRIFDEFKNGFLKVCGGEVLKMFQPEELELLICGNPILDFKALESVTKYEGFSKDSQTIKYFWEIIHALSEDDKKKFLCFVTGSDRAPINGLGSMDLIIAKNGPDSDRLMTAHTCFNYLLLPEYGNKEKMKKLIITAIENASGFGLR